MTGVDVCRPLRADECLPVLTHRLVTDAGSKTGTEQLGDEDVTSRRRHKDSHKNTDDCKKKSRKVFCFACFAQLLSRVYYFSLVILHPAVL